MSRRPIVGRFGTEGGSGAAGEGVQLNVRLANFCVVSGVDRKTARVVWMLVVYALLIVAVAVTLYLLGVSPWTTVAVGATWLVCVSLLISPPGRRWQQSRRERGTGSR